MDRTQLLRRGDASQSSSVGEEASRLQHEREAGENVPPRLVLLRRRPSAPSGDPLLELLVRLLHALYSMLDRLVLALEEVLSKYAEDGDELGLGDEASVDWSKSGESEKESSRGDGEVDCDERATSEG